MAKKRNTQKQESPGGDRNRVKLKIHLRVSGKECLTHLNSYKKFRKSRLHECWILNHKQKACKKTQRREVVKIIDNFVGQIHRVISLNQVFKRKLQLTYIRQPISGVQVLFNLNLLESVTQWNNEIWFVFIAFNKFTSVTNIC